MREAIQRTAAYSAAIAVAALGYYFAQSRVNAHRAELPVIVYLDCLQKVGTINWEQIPGPKPSSSEICKDLADR